MPDGLAETDRWVLRHLLDAPGALSHWGEAMLTSQTDPLVLGDAGLIGLGLASVPGAPADPTLHVTQGGRHALQGTANRVVELVFELVRNLVNPDAPSRLQSLFAYETVAQAEDFITARRTGPQEIWTIDVPDSIPTHRGDGGWLGVPDSPLDFIGAAVSYWSGAPTKTSVPHDREVLVPLEAATVASLVKSVP
jgi:hypothetical protein